jgi:hypothetical protein
MRVFRILASLALLIALLGIVVGCGGGSTATPATSLGTLSIDDVNKVSTFTSTNYATIRSIVAVFTLNSSTGSAIVGDVAFKLTTQTATTRIWSLQFNKGSTEVPAANGQYVMKVYAILSDGTRELQGLGQIVNIEGTSGTGSGGGTSSPPLPPWDSTN